MYNKIFNIMKDWFGTVTCILLVFLVAFIYNQIFIKDKPIALAELSTNSSVSVSPLNVKLLPQKIENVKVGDRVSGYNPEISNEERSGFLDPDPNTWKLLRLEMPKSDGNILNIEILRPAEWFCKTNPVVGKMMFIDLLELGAWGEAKVISIEESPQIYSGPGNVVTGKFTHKNAKIVNLYIEGIENPIGCTETHPFWSVDRLAFVEAGNLHENELLKLHNGTNARIIEISHNNVVKNVYNLEVHNEHVYEVTESGILVHNACEFILHHAVPKFLGGFDDQIYAILRTAAHDEYHKLLRECLDAKGIWYPVFKVGTRTGSAADWRLFFQENPTAQYQAFEAVIEAGTKLAAKYPDEAKKLFDAFWETMRQNKYNLIY